ncbi:MAG: hypothetical protein J5925_05930 [Clostridia bacterium]|nr:hypothetical protein [Clostridia bacterium]
MTRDEIKNANRLLFERLALLLNERPDFINSEMVRVLTREHGLSVRDSFAHLLAAAIGLDTSFPQDRAVWENYFPHMVHYCDERDYTQDGFYRLVTACKNAVRGEWELKNFVMQPFAAFVCGDPLCLPDGRVIPQIGFFDCVYRYPGVLQNGREWMTLLPNEIITQRVPVKKARGRVLTYGLGLGYFAFSAANKPQVDSVTVVERDESVIELFKTFILPALPCADKINIVCADAFDYAEHIAPNGKFDYIFADIWHDPTDGVELYKRFKTLEIDGNAEYGYWIEDTLKLYMKGGNTVC